ncbi:uncharacterized protein LOC131597615 [Vicia villosa]|uniref:uncharacterized protein LOC131597615 n=1 Tax=Vicia villosa TaxID=3911 RepID=UPI00273BBF85|nr:uncharacterized protein LOC131597615 [Vicia villosa]
MQNEVQPREMYVRRPGRKIPRFYLTERGIEANPDKCRAFSDLPTPNSKKSIQTLNGMLTSLSRFVAKSAQHALPLFKLLRKETTFEWTEECERALSHLKQALSSPPVLSRPKVGKTLYLYLAVAIEAVSTALICETPEGQKPIYFTSKALQGPEIRYQRIEKVGLALITATRRLRHYFLAHTIVVRTEQPVKQLLARPDMARQMLHWLLELAEFDVKYEGRKALKAQVLANFVVEMAFPETTNCNAQRWIIYVDGTSSSTGSGARIILENGEGTLIEVSLSLSFPTSNNQAEYEALLAGLRLANDLEAEDIKEFVTKLGTTQHFASLEHPQTNGQAEAANRVILRGLRRRLDEIKRGWVEELHSVLWAYRTTPHSTTGETPFRLTYGTEAVIPVEIHVPSRRIEEPLETEGNIKAVKEELDLVEEIRTGAVLREASLKQKIALRHDAKVIKREFKVDSLVLKKNHKDSREGKLAANWEGPYRVRERTEDGAYYLENLQGEELARPWNAEKLKQYYS